MGRDGVVPSAGRTESWPCAASALLEVFASDLKSGFAGCLGAGTTAAVAKPDESPLGGCTLLSVLAGRCRVMGNLRPPSFTGFASPALPSAPEMAFVPAMLPSGLPAHQNHIQVLSLNP